VGKSYTSSPLERLLEVWWDSSTFIFSMSVTGVITVQLYVSSALLIFIDKSTSNKLEHEQSMERDL
jgi:hypothetical protein